ncbi:MAG: SIR2 family protein [Pseudomonadota bacterium]|nr:SIR2 family protein [Pseudomonadota bacterium]
MASSELLTTLREGIRSGKIVPYIGADTLSGVTAKATGDAIPADSDSLILAMNDGKPMAPRLMYEFPRAAMNLENKKGRKFIERFLNTTYGETEWTPSVFHRWLAEQNLPYIVDINRDTQLQDFYADRPHTLIVGVARIAGSDYRFRLYQYYSGEYREISQQEVDSSLPVLFKPMGSPKPEANYIASDADYVDYITELMGGFAIPAFLKDYRQGKQYLFCGLRMLRDTERMVLSDIIYAAAEPAGWVLLPDATDKEKRYCDKKGLVIVNAGWQELMDGTLAQAG